MRWPGASLRIQTASGLKHAIYGADVLGHLIDCGPCPYLPGRAFRAFAPVDPALAAGNYRALMDVGCRRSGADFYIPMCEACSECRPIRVDLRRFAPRRDQRRCVATNADLIVTRNPRGMDNERQTLFTRYQAAVHAKEEQGDPTRFLCEDAGVPGGELHARDASGRLLAVSLVDIFADCWSSVYCYWDPAERARGLGTFLALAEISQARAAGCRWLYLGFLVRPCAKMAYKARFRPHEVLVDGRWVEYA